MPRKKKLAKRFRQKFFGVLRHSFVRDLLTIILIVAVLYFGIKGAMVLFLRTEMPMVAVDGDSMTHPNELWRNYYEELENVDPSEFPFQGGLEVGDLLIIRGIGSSDDVSIGDVILWCTDEGSKPIVHRVAVKNVDENGRLYYQTRSDKYFSLDKKIYPDDIVGEVVLAIPKLGYLSLWFGS